MSELPSSPIKKLFKTNEYGDWVAKFHVYSETPKFYIGKMATDDQGGQTRKIAKSSHFHETPEEARAFLIERKKRKIAAVESDLAGLRESLARLESEVQP